MLGCHNALAFDLTAACSGFVLGLVTATRFIRGTFTIQSLNEFWASVVNLLLLLFSTSEAGLPLVN